MPFHDVASMISLPYPWFIIYQTLGSGTPPTGKSPNAGFGHYSKEKDAVGYQYFVETNVDGSRNVGSPAHNFYLEFTALQSLARNVKSVTMCGPGAAGNAECKPPPSAT